MSVRKTLAPVTDEKAVKQDMINMLFAVSPDILNFSTRLSLVLILVSFVPR